ncbi:MAG: hypothetical protein LIP11_01375 [Clostridiales bacterium]|nr:hypothetical protein [Clostridiales bacterium]
MNNRYFNYPHKDLWNIDVWESRRSELTPLANWIGQYNLEHCRIPAKPEGERRTEGSFDPKANALTYPEKVQELKEKGLHYHCTSMSFGWVAIIPEEHLGKEGYSDEMDTVIVLVNADQTDPNWCMYVLEKYADYVDAAGKERFAILFIAADRLNVEGGYISIVQEAIVIFHLNYMRFYLDVSAVKAAGVCLAEIPGFAYTDESGATPMDPDAAIEKRGGILVLPAAKRWTNKDSLICKLINGDTYSNLTYDKEALINSPVGRDLAQAMYLEYHYDDAEDPELLRYWDDMGLKCEFHDKKGEQWITFVPKAAYEQTEEKLPCVCIFQEVNRFDPHQAVTGFAYFLKYHEIAAQGDCMLLYFVLETLDDNDLLHEILEDAKTMYPIDPERVYITGHSHDGRFAAEYTRRHQREIAAVATLGNEPGQLSEKVTSGFFVVTDEQLDIQASVDTPLIDISGFNERNSQFPLNIDAPDVRPGQWVAVDTFEKRAESWQRRLRSANAPMRTVEEIAATRYSDNKAERCIGVPADYAEVLTLDKSENYIVDIKNKAGKSHLRIVALGNMPHTVTPIMVELSWDFLRRFGRNQETGETIELE